MARSLSSRNAAPLLFDGVEITSDTLTGRGGLALFSRYLRNIEILPHLDRLFGSVRKNSKGLPVAALFHQIFCFFLDGTSRHLVRFDELAEDEGYAAAIETEPGHMALTRVRQRVAPVDYDELLDICDIWVETALDLPDKDKRTMRRLVRSQSRFSDDKSSISLKQLQAS